MLFPGASHLPRVMVGQHRIRGIRDPVALIEVQRQRMESQLRNRAPDAAHLNLVTLPKIFVPADGAAIRAGMVAERIGGDNHVKACIGRGRLAQDVPCGVVPIRGGATRVPTAYEFRRRLGDVAAACPHQHTCTKEEGGEVFSHGADRTVAATTMHRERELFLFTVGKAS